MLDINQAMDDRESGDHDPQGHLHGLPRWSREIALRQASDEGMDELSEMHWRVIYTLRGRYREHGRAESARQIMRVLERDYLEEGGRRYLYLLFPKGPISQGSRLAGVPAPPYSGDPSFGSFA
ncbi:MAG: TusE/DsrC/DsvC family sulfur relay protein [Casimicrobiaceae bacterium]